MKNKLKIFVFIILLDILCVDISNGATVTGVTPNQGSLNGGTRITISGSGFAENQFNFGTGNEHLGNYVELISGTLKFVCDIHVDGCTQTQVTCYTRPMPEGDYTIRVKVDDIPIPDASHCSLDSTKCIFKTRFWNTPTIDKIEPNSGVPGTFVTITGRIITTRFGSNLEESQNGLPNKMLRIYHNGQTCEVKDINTDTFYDIALDDPSTTYGYGHMKCKMSGTYVGNQNFSFLVELEYGRSKPNINTLLLSSDGKIKMFQTYAVIKTVSPSVGSTNGGTVLTITGENFDSTESSIVVTVGGQDCKVINMTSTEITCTTPVQPPSQTSYTGNRGLLKEEWTRTSVTYANRANILSLTNSAADYQSSIIDSSSFSEDVYSNNVARLSGYFIPSITAKYRFYVMADDFASLYFSETGVPAAQTEIASCPSYATIYGQYPVQTSKLFDLTAGKAYYMTVLHGNFLNSSSVKVAARSYTAPVTGDMSGSARQEIQSIIVNSTVRPEQQEINLSGLTSSTTYTAEVQTVTVSDITGPNVDAFYRLGLNGVYTAPIPAKGDVLAVVTALNNLASLSPDTVTVAQTSPSATSEQFKITFNTARGNLPLLTTMVEPASSSLSVSVVENTAGIAGTGTAYIEIDGVVSPGILPAATATDVQSALTTMFGVRCPPVIASPEVGASDYLEDFEGTGASLGEVVSEVEPLCGRYSVKNPKYIYKTPALSLGVKIGTFKTLCFGYQGEINQLKVTYDYMGATSKFTEYFNLDLLPTVKSWNYTCIDIGTTIVSKNSAQTVHRVWQIEVLSNRNTEDFYIDTVALLIPAKASTDRGEGINMQRYRAAKPGGKPMKQITVTGTGPYTVTMAPYECGYNFDKFKITASQTTISMTTTQIIKASPPVTGSFDVSFNSKSVSIPVTLTDKAVQTVLQTELSDTIGDINVKYQGDCANFAYVVTFLTNRGDQPAMTVSSQTGLLGESPSAMISTDRDGSLWLDPIQGDMLRTPHGKPQVMVKVNNIPTKCNGTCTFEWSTASTPQITTASQTQGTQALGTVLVITGSGFSTVMTENTVTIGGVACIVTASSVTSLTCNVGNGPMGQYDIIVIVDGKGQATGTLKFTYTAEITGISPASGSLGGGTLLTLSGSGFASNAVVQVNGVDCKVKQSQPGKVTCLTPKSSSASSVSVTVQQYGNTLTSPTQFTYDASKTPTISSMSRSKASVFGGESITVTGSGFGASATSTDALKINGAVATITSYSDTQVVATLPPNAPGTYNLELSVGSYGFANAVNGGQITYGLVVKDIHPTRGSLYGGTIVTVIGEGFGTTASLVTVSFGKYNCQIQTITDTLLTCRTSSTSKTHVITNQGSHPTYGPGFAWEPKSLSVEVGDKVNWQWTAPTSGYQFCVNQTENVTATETKVNGFSSGPQSASGSYLYTPTSAAPITYWSGYVDGAAKSISLHGVVLVTDRSDSAQSLTLMANGFEAQYDITTKGTYTPSNTASCHWDVTPVSSCSSLTQDPTKFNFLYQACSTGTVTSISNNQATGTEAIDLVGTGFSSTSCQNEISLGNYKCVVSSATDTKVTCTVNTQQTMKIGDVSYYEVRNSNRGQHFIALPTEVQKSFILLPHISTVTPDKGSVEGGATLTITGGGFIPSATSVSVGYFDCAVLSVDYTTITCTVPRSGKQEVKEVKVSVTRNGQTVLAKCSSINGVCAYLYDASMTPSVTQVSPNSVSGSTTLVITGAWFGTTSSAVTVMVGGEACTVSSVTNSTITCSIAAAPVGEHDVVVIVASTGKASPTVKVTSPAVVTGVNPSSGSTQGQTVVTILGNGFAFNKTSVQIGGNECKIISTTFAQVVCSTPAGTGTQAITVTSNGIAYTSSLTFTYASSSTPTVTGVSPTSGKAGDVITVTGTSFSSTLNGNTITLGGVTCSVTSATSTSIQCTLGSQTPGQYAVMVDVNSLGRASSVSTFTYTVSASSISPTSGSLGGGQIVSITGTGFGPTTSTVTICGKPCTVNAASGSSTKLVCSTPPSTGTVTVSCDVVVTDNGQTSTLGGGFQYDATKSPSITAVTPSFGGTSGGTTVTISGTGFGTTQGDVTVNIGGVACVVQSVTNTQVVCVTGARSAGSVDTKVELQVKAGGNAQQIGAAFSYMYAWSSTNSWGGNNPPGAGEIVVIPKGMTILLDQSTPVLKMLLIQGGKVIFDEQNLELNAEYILITDGGALQVGTEANPFQSAAAIILHGNYRCQQLPIYGCKVLAVREGTLDLHGKVTPITWTHLAQTANAGTNTIKLMQSVNWEVGSLIVLPTTGHRHSQSQTETKTITAISADGLTLTLDSALQYKHIGETDTFGSTTVELRGEVGLLSHNVKVRGYSDQQFVETIPKCEEGFNTGEFTTQTCFQGRFGEEMGSDEFGVQMIIHAPRPNEHLAIARISYIEVAHAGQAFRLGRYPIHFHLNGDMSSSYVRGCGIHHTYNRAVNIHGSHNTLIEHTVIYNIMGGAFFLEDGVETGNTFQYNLATFVKASTSLLNDDITPASFWVTNPNNTIQHNAAAGGTHFGYWYRMHDHPDGPSFDPNICPKNVPIGVFQNNTAHSFGWFGLWIFHDYLPREGGSCAASAPYKVAVFNSLTAWNCEKGAEGVNIGNVQFDGFVLVGNEKAGYEGKLVIESNQYDINNGYAVKNSVIVARSQYLDQQPEWSGVGCTVAGIVLPYGNGLMISGVKFYNFDQSGCQAFTFTRIDGTCTDLCGGFTYKLQNIEFSQTTNKLKFSWLHHGVLVDLDGSLTGLAAGTSVVPTMNHLPKPGCTSISSGFNMGVPASSCDPSIKFHRLSFNEILPQTLIGKHGLITNRFGQEIFYYAFKRITHKKGWMVILPQGEKYKLEFQNAGQITNISYAATFYEFNNLNDHVEICQALDQQPDRFYFDGSAKGRNMSSAALDINSNKHGDWYFSNVSSEMCYLVAGKLTKKRSSPKLHLNAVDRVMAINSFKCYFKDCVPPPDPDTIPPSCSRPSTAVMWSNATMWSVDSNGYVTNSGSGTNGLPQAGQKVKIMKGTWVVADTSIPRMEALVLEGTLELDHGPSQNRDFTINVIYLYIIGGRLIIGCDEANPFLGTASIILRGDQSTPVWPKTEGPNIGSKAIAAFGGLDLHGKDVGVAWTRLQQTAAAGSNQIVLAEPVTWAVGDEIIITATGYKVTETETNSIAAIAGDQKTITLTKTLAYKHIVSKETFSNGKGYSIGAEVGLLTRNIKIVGEEYTNINEESFGARVLVGVTADTTRSYTGYARVSNVEFKRTAQEGFTESYDPRFSIAYLDIGRVDSNGAGGPAIKPCYVKKSSFHHGFGTAIGSFGTNGLEIQDNIIHHTVGPSIETNSDSTRIRRNLVTVSLWRGSYNGRAETNNRDHHGAIKAITATKLVLQGNAISASERVGYHGPPEDCTTDAEPWMDNTIHSCLIGAGLFPTDLKNPSFNSNPRCLQYANFTIWKAFDFGIYYNSIFDVELKQNTLVDNGVGIFSMVIGPSSLMHEFANRYVKVKDSVIVGQSDSFDCTTDVVDTTDMNIVISTAVGSRSWRVDDKGKIGVGTTAFVQGGNNACDKPFVGSMAYNAIGGRMEITGVTFANFRTTSCGKDVALTTNPKIDDAQHPMLISGTTLVNVGSENNFLMHRPRLSSINPADCVDMDCDGLKKALIKDSDGTFLGVAGNAFSESEWEWNGDPRRGLGDYRIPKAMLTYPDGTRISYDVLAKYKGIIRDGSCTYKSYAQAWVCTNWNYEQVVIESMDEDTETRRLSPVAVLGWDNGGNGYIDLINGPQDHGWCSGYTCQKRLSTFTAVMATGRNYSLYFTSTTPEHVRYRMLNADNTKSVGIATYYNVPNRLDVYCDGTYVLPNNGHYDSDQKVLLNAPTTWDQYIPNPSTGACGENYLDYEWKEQHIVLRGGSVVDVKIQPVIVLGFNMPTMTVDQFFGPNLINNLAAFLGVPAGKIRVMNVVTGVNRRRKRSTGPNTMYYVEIGNQPCSNVNCTGSTVSTLTFNDLQQLAVAIINSYQAGNLSNILNITINGLSVAEALPPVTDPTWAKVISAGDNYLSVLKVPRTFHIKEQPMPSSEGNPFTVQPKLHMRDILGQQITLLGASIAPWKVSVSLKPGTGTNAQAELTGTKNVTFVDGWANFTDLGITHEGSGYVLEFTVSYPTDVVFNVLSSPLIVKQRGLKTAVASKSGDVYQNNIATVTLEIRDNNTDSTVLDINWKGHLWTVTASMSSPSTFGYRGSLSGTKVGTFDPATGRVSLTDLRFDQPGIAVIKFTVASNPPGYQFEVDEYIEVIPSQYATVTEDTRKEMKIKVNKDYATYGKPEFGAAVINSLVSSQNSYIRAKNMVLSQGSVIITTTITGNTTTVQQIIDGVCDSIKTGTTFTYNGQTFTLSSYMTINNVQYYGVSCGDIESKKDNAKIGLIVGIVICCVVIVALLAGILYWRLVVYPKTKTHKPQFSNVVSVKKGKLTQYHIQPYNRYKLEKDPRYIGRTGNSDEILWREDTFQSLREKSWLPDQIYPPANTAFTEKKIAFTGHQ